eukprot:gene13901-biopygen3813
MVGQVKRCLREVIGNAKSSFDELNTVLSEIENTLNCRPLTYDYDEPGVEVLTQSHLIFGRRVSSLSEEILRDKAVDERKDGEESERCEEVQEQAQRPRRAAARDAQWKTRLMLDIY